MDYINEYLANIISIILISLIGWVSSETISYIRRKKKVIIETVGQDKYKYIYNIAKLTYFAIEQVYKNSNKIIKKDSFNAMLKDKIPGISDDEIDYFRESVVGEFNKIKNGSLIAVTEKEARNILHHRKFFALLKYTVFNCNESFGLQTTDQLLIIVKLGLGMYDLHLIEGSEVYVPQSISFAKMGQKRFEEFYSNTVDFILKKYFPDADQEFIEQELINFI